MVSCDFTPMLNYSNVDEATNNLTDFSADALNYYCPLRKVTLRNADLAYITPVVRILLKTKNRMFNERRFSRAEEVGKRIRQIISDNSRKKNDGRGTKSWCNSVNSQLGREGKKIPLNSKFKVEDLNIYFDN